MKLIVCPYCNRWKFANTETNEDIWIKPTLYEEMALDQILNSKLLQISVKEIAIIEEVCDECVLTETN